MAPDLTVTQLHAKSSLQEIKQSQCCTRVCSKRFHGECHKGTGLLTWHLTNVLIHPKYTIIHTK